MGNQSSQESNSNNSRNSRNGNEFQDIDEFDDEDQQQNRPSYWQMMKQGYQELVNAIIRPPRCKYSVNNLGPQSFEFCGRRFQRTDFELTNERGMKLVCSHWEPLLDSRRAKVLPCVIYMHGNSSARVEAIMQLSLVLSLGATMLTFDFAGSGRSDGEYVSLGAYEKDDLKCVIDHLRESGTTSTIALWGRSMGAATALMHVERDPSIAGMICDSSFADLTLLAEELVEKGRKNGLFAPSFVVSMVIRSIRSTIQKTAEFDIRVLSPISHAERCFIPALFVAAEGDEFIPPHHSEKIYEKYGGDKNLIKVEGDHNTMRPKFMLDSAAIFLANTLQIPNDWIVEEAAVMNDVVPWSSRASRLYRDSMTNGHERQQQPVSSTSEDEINSDLIKLMMINANFERNGNTESVGGTDNSGSTSSSHLPELSIGMTHARQEMIQSQLLAVMGGQGKKPNNNNSDNNSNNNSSIASNANCDPLETGHSNESWTCHVCTLINEAQVPYCLACETERSVS